MTLRPFFLLVPALLSFASVRAEPEDVSSGDGKPAVSSEAPSADALLKKLTVAPGLKVDLWAAEPLLINPVAFCFDNLGRVFVAETGRRRSTVPDIRRNEPWVAANLALRTVEDRRAFLERQYPPNSKRKPTSALPDRNGDGFFDLKDWEVESERLKLVVDTDGDGRADAASVFADGFKTALTGIGAGVAAHEGVVYYTCVPDLWRLSGEKGGAATQREAMLTGFGPHVVYSGHDMHGPKIGPDGKLYWSNADSGARVVTKEGTVLDCPDSGTVFRCDLDGRNAELVAVGLRNPQSLAFNDLGDLFTGDNNADGGDKARWTHVVEGGDYGWRLGWQFLREADQPARLGAWNSEGMWRLDVAKTNLSLLPPVGHIGHGPAGIAYYPGTGLPAAYRDHFFYADFPGGVRSFKLIPDGATYRVDNPGDFLQDNSARNMNGKLLWGLEPSDVQFGVDGGAYVLDWVQGWEKTGKGRIFRVHDPAIDASPLVQQTKKLLAEGMSKRPLPELLQLLGHADQRVRLGAQFSLAARGALNELASAASRDQRLLARVHAVWGLGQIEGKTPGATKGQLLALLKNPTAEVRAQAAKVLNGRDDAASQALTQLLKDPEPRVRFFAAQSLGRMRRPVAAAALFQMLHENADRDAFVRHAAVVALASGALAKDLSARANDPSESVRAGALLALRRQASPEVAAFLADRTPQLALEAARAIHDGAIPAAWPQLAALAGKPQLVEPMSRRAINTNYLIGNADAAQRLAAVAADASVAAPRRIEALRSLAKWNEPFKADRVTGLWRPLPQTRDSQAPVKALTQIVPGLLKDGSEAIRLAALEAAGNLKVVAVEGSLLAVVRDANASGSLRAAALRALDASGSAKVPDAVTAALAGSDPALLGVARNLAGKASPGNAVKVNSDLLGKGTLREQQLALANIAAQSVPEADGALAAQLDLLISGKLPAGLALDLIEACASRPNPAIKEKLARFNAARKAADPLANWRECLEGGDPILGRTIFAEKAEAGCLRCHKVKGEGGDVGPDLGVANAKRDRTYLLQAIVDPNAVIAQGYQNVLITLQDGNLIAGLVNAEDENEVTLASLTDGKKQKIKKADIKELTPIPSAMPPGLGEVLGKRALRDVIEYLATLE